MLTIKIKYVVLVKGLKYDTRKIMVLKGEIPLLLLHTHTHTHCLGLYNRDKVLKRLVLAFA